MRYLDATSVAEIANQLWLRRDSTDARLGSAHSHVSPLLLSPNGSPSDQITLASSKRTD